MPFLEPRYGQQGTKMPILYSSTDAYLEVYTSNRLSETLNRLREPRVAIDNRLLKEKLTHRPHASIEPEEKDTRTSSILSLSAPPTCINWTDPSILHCPPPMQGTIRGPLLSLQAAATTRSRLRAAQPRCDDFAAR